MGIIMWVGPGWYVKDPDGDYIFKGPNLNNLIDYPNFPVNEILYFDTEEAYERRFNKVEPTKGVFDQYNDLWLKQADLFENLTVEMILASNRIMVIKVVRLKYDIGLKEAKDMLDFVLEQIERWPARKFFPIKTFDKMKTATVSDCISYAQGELPRGDVGELWVKLWLNYAVKLIGPIAKF